MASRSGAGSPEEARLPCTSAQQLTEEITKLSDTLAPEEKEDTWQKFERALLRFAAVTRGGGYKFTDVYVRAVGPGPLGDKLVACVMSDRGKLSGVATDLLNTMIPRLALNFAPLIIHYLPPIIRIFSRSNKVYTRRSEKCLTTIITHCPAPSMIGMIRLGVTDKAEGTRKATGAALEKIMTEWDRQTIGSRGIVELELGLRKMATERDPEVRKMGKRMWEIYTAKWPERVDDFTAPLTPTIQKYLDINAEKKAATRKGLTLAQTTVVRQAVARGPATNHAQKPNSETANHTGPQKPSTEATAPLLARVRVTSLSKPVEPPVAAEMASFTPLEKPDPFAPVHPKSFLGRSVSSAVAGPSTFASRPIQMRSASMMANGGHDLAHLASNGIAEVVGPSRPRIPHSSTMSDLMGPPRFNDGPVRPQRPVHLLLGMDVRDPTTPLPKSAGPVRPTREPLSTSQYGKSHHEPARKEQGHPVPAKRPAPPVFEANQVAAQPTIPAAPPPPPPPSPPRESPATLLPPALVELVSAPRHQIDKLAPSTPLCVAPEMADKPPAALLSAIHKPVEEYSTDGGAQQKDIADTETSDAGAAMSEVPSTKATLPLGIEPTCDKPEEIKPPEQLTSHVEPTLDLPEVIKPSLEDASVAQLEALLAKAKEKERARSKAVDASAQHATIIPYEQTKEIAEARVEELVDTGSRTKATGSAKETSKGDGKRPLGSNIPPDAKREEAPKPTASTTSKQAEPKKAESSGLIRRKPPLPGAPAKPAATLKRSTNPPTLSASTSSSSASRARAPIPTDKARTVAPAALPATSKALPKLGESTTGRQTGTKVAVPAKPSSPRQARVKLKAALPPPPSRTRPAPKSASVLPSVPESRATGGDGKASFAPKAGSDKDSRPRAQPGGSTSSKETLRQHGSGLGQSNGLSRSTTTVLALAKATPLPESPRKALIIVALPEPTMCKAVTALAIETPLPPSPQSQRGQCVDTEEGTQHRLPVTVIASSSAAGGPVSATCATSAVSSELSPVTFALPRQRNIADQFRDGETSSDGMKGLNSPRQALDQPSDHNVTAQPIPFPSVLDAHSIGNRGPKAEHDWTDGARKGSENCRSLDSKTTSTVARMQALYEARETISGESPLRPRAVSLKTTMGGMTPRKGYPDFSSSTPAGSPAAWSLRSV